MSASTWMCNSLSYTWITSTFQSSCASLQPSKLSGLQLAGGTTSCDLHLSHTNTSWMLMIRSGETHPVLLLRKCGGSRAQQHTVEQSSSGMDWSQPAACHDWLYFQEKELDNETHSANAIQWQQMSDILVCIVINFTDWCVKESKVKATPDCLFVQRAWEKIMPNNCLCHVCLDIQQVTNYSTLKIKALYRPWWLHLPVLTINNQLGRKTSHRFPGIISWAK